MRTYEIHGIGLASEVELDAPTADRPADLTIRRGEPRAASGVPEGRLLSELSAGGCQWVVEREDGTWLHRFDGVAEFEITDEQIVAHLSPGVDEGYLSILATGGVLAHVLAGSRRLVLHASAVEHRGEVVAIVGFSGAGKSTSAAQLCAAGAMLVTDDTLAISLESGPPTCFRGSSALRLRPEIDIDVDPLRDWNTGSSVDGRSLLRPPQVSAGKLQLSSVVAIERTKAVSAIEIERLSGSEAVTILLSYPRAAGWVDRDRVRAHFELSADLCERIPVHRVRVPPSGLEASSASALLAALVAS